MSVENESLHPNPNGLLVNIPVQNLSRILQGWLFWGRRTRGSCVTWESFDVRGNVLGLVPLWMGHGWQECEKVINASSSRAAAEHDDQRKGDAPQVSGLYDEQATVLGGEWQCLLAISNPSSPPSATLGDVTLVETESTFRVLFSLCCLLECGMTAQYSQQKLITDDNPTVSHPKKNLKELKLVSNKFAAKNKFCVRQAKPQQRLGNLFVSQLLWYQGQFVAWEF